jgi:DNA-binding CsgD family transcriptional regulator
LDDWLTESDRRQVLEIGWSLAANRSEDELSAVAVKEALSFIGADEADFNAVNLAARRVRVGLFPHSEMAGEVASQLTDVIAEHPVIRHLERSAQILPVRLTDLVPASQFLRSRIYETLFRPRGLQFQLVVPVQTDKRGRTGAAYAMNRSKRDFDESAMARAVALQPVVAALHAALSVRKPTPEQIDIARAKSGLTPREVEILGFVASGMTANAIGHAQRISVKTVRKHLENAYCKIGVHDRLQAVAYCRDLGLLES